MLGGSRLKVEIKQGDCLIEMAKLAEGSIDAIVSDPPYGLSFMGRDWDHGIPGVAFWTEALRILKPGAHMLAFGGTRTFHRLTVAIEDAGFEIRDCLGWIYGSGFPKSLDISKAIDKVAGKTRVIVGRGKGRTGEKAQPHGSSFSDDGYLWPGDFDITAPATPEAAKWSGFGTALKPAWEPVILARKPLIGTVAANVCEFGTGGLNIDRCRISGSKPLRENTIGTEELFGLGSRLAVGESQEGRFPANLIHDGSLEVLAVFPESEVSGAARTGKPSKVKGKNDGSFMAWKNGTGALHNDSGSAARFFYCAKASRSDRGPDNDHPTVKPTDLLRYLCRLICPPGGTVCDPFMGSGSTGKAAIAEGFSFIGIEIDPHYCEIAAARLSKAELLKAMEEIEQ